MSPHSDHTNAVELSEARSQHALPPEGLMSNGRPNLIVENDAALRATLTGQISLEDDFTTDKGPPSVVAGCWTGGYWLDTAVAS